MGDRYRELSKAVAHALRHQPRRYGLELDEQGWASVPALVQALARSRPAWRSIGHSDLVAMIEASDKRRYEIAGDRIRALYGHSVPGRISKPRSQPPELLFHGTRPTVVAAILAEGLRPMSRQYVHLSVDVGAAQLVGRRRSDSPVVLEVAAGEAVRSGVDFRRGSDDVWLAPFIPPAYVRLRGSVE